jgi:hypothetical protein
MKNSIPLVFILMISLLLGACSSNNVDFVIDNPTNRTLKVRIDDQTYSIKPHQDQALTLSAGRHLIETERTGKLSFLVYANGKGCLVNPTLSPYLVVNEVYATNDESAKGFRPLEKKIELEGIEYTGPFDLNDDLFIEKNWSYGAHENFPEQIIISSTSNGNIKSKLFTAADFIQYIEKDSADKGYHEKNRTPSKPKSYAMAQPETFSKFSDHEIDVPASKLRDWYAQYLQADTAQQQRQLQKNYRQLVTDLLSVYSPKTMTLSKEENLLYDKLVRRTGDLMGRSVWVEARK